MPDVNVAPFEIETTTRHGDLVRADVYLSDGEPGPVPAVLGASPYQKSLRHLPPHPLFPFTEYGPIQLYFDSGYAYVVMDLPGTGRSGGTCDPVSRREGEAIHDMIEHVAAQGWCDGEIGMIGMPYYCWGQWNAARTGPPQLKTIVAYDGVTDMYRDWMYHGGIPIQGFLSTWLFGSVLLQHQAQGIGFRAGDKDRVVYDMLSHRFRLVKGPKQLLIAHPGSFAAAQLYFYDEQFHRRELLPWYDHHLKHIHNDVMSRPAPSRRQLKRHRPRGPTPTRAGPGLAYRGRPDDPLVRPEDRYRHHHHGGRYPRQSTFMSARETGEQSLRRRHNEPTRY